MIYLLRHGDAEARNGDDAARKLTAKGRRQAEAAGKALAALRVTIDACLSSPKVRAIETARIACRPLGLVPEEDQALSGGEFDALKLAEGRGEVLLVGHDPDFSHAIESLTGARARLRKGGLAIVEEETIHSLLTPRQLRAIAGT